MDPNICISPRLLNKSNLQGFRDIPLGDEHVLEGTSDEFHDEGNIVPKWTQDHDDKNELDTSNKYSNLMSNLLILSLLIVSAIGIAITVGILFNFQKDNGENIVNLNGPIPVSSPTMMPSITQLKDNIPYETKSMTNSSKTYSSTPTKSPTVSTRGSEVMPADNTLDNETQMPSTTTNISTINNPHIEVSPQIVSKQTGEDGKCIANITLAAPDRGDDDTFKHYYGFHADEMSITHNEETCSGTNDGNNPGWCKLSGENSNTSYSFFWHDKQEYNSQIAVLEIEPLGNLSTYEISVTHVFTEEEFYYYGCNSTAYLWVAEVEIETTAPNGKKSRFGPFVAEANRDIKTHDKYGNINPDYNTDYWVVLECDSDCDCNTKMYSRRK